MKFPDPRTQKPLISFLIIAAIFQLVGGFMGWVSGPSIDGWYESLNRSPLNPPGAVFGIVWPCLYLFLAYGFWSVSVTADSPERTFVLRLFGAHMILNWAWSPVFFLAHQSFAAYVIILVLIFTASMLLWLIWPIRKSAAVLLIPYLAWLTFAGHLSHYIWKNN